MQKSKSQAPNKPLLKGQLQFWCAKLKTQSEIVTAKFFPTNPGWIMDQFISFSEFSRNYPWFVRDLPSDDFAFDFHLSTLSNCLYVIGIAKQTFKGTKIDPYTFDGDYFIQKNVMWYYGIHNYTCINASISKNNS